MADLTPPACRAARALLNLGQRELATLAKVSATTVNKFEKGEDVRAESVNRLAFAFEMAGVQILNGNSPGARMRPGR